MKRLEPRAIGTGLTLLIACALSVLPEGAGLLAQDSAPGPSSDSFVNFNFERVDIRMLVKIVGEMTGRRFVIDDDISGTVSIVTPAKIPSAEVYELFISILESKGYSLRREGGAYHVIALPKTSLPLGVIGADGDQGLVTKLLRLENISAVETAKLVAPMIRGGKEGAVAAFAPTNHLIVTDTAAAIARVEKIIEEMDRPGSTRTIEVLPLRFAAADDLARQLMLALQGATSPNSSVGRHLKQMAVGEGALPAEVLAIPAAQANSLILVGTQRDLAEMKRVVALLDVEPTRGGGRLQAIFLKYISAEEAATAITALLEKGGREAEGAPAGISIEADKSGNALLVNAAPHEFQWIKELVDDIDRAPQQVLVEIMIVEVNASKGLDLGVEWAAVDEPVDGRRTIVGRSRPGETDILRQAIEEGVYPQGLAIGLATGVASDGTPLIPFLLRALSSRNDINILSKVPLWAQDNKEASVSVVENIPILKSTIEGGAGTSRDVIQNIDRMDVGIKLVFTPHVNPENEITLDLHPSIEAILSEGPPDQPFTPTIAKREVKTTVTVPDGSTIVISGLVREDKVSRRYKVPLLGDIPLLGALFRYDSNSVKRTNLLIFVSPHLVTDTEKAAEQKARWERETGVLQQAAED
jgi:general secretion pathway protein D